MKIEDCLLILKAPKDVEHPLRFYNFGYLAIMLASMGCGFLYSVAQNMQDSQKLLALFIGLTGALILFVLAFWSHVEAKKCIN